MTANPILYSLQNCPYAMRARMAIFKSHQCVELRAIKLDNKPSEMLAVSPKGSVPVLILPKRHESQITGVIDESLEIMLWSLSQDDPHDLLDSANPKALSEMVDLITEFDHVFVPLSNAFGCAKRYHEANIIECRTACENYLNGLEQRLDCHCYLYSEQESLLDIALLPYLRKFSRIDKKWFREAPYPKLRAWLTRYVQSREFSKVMEQHELWLDNRKRILFGEREVR
jgi:glutathione S-transferase